MSRNKSVNTINIHPVSKEPDAEPLSAVEEWDKTLCRFLDSRAHESEGHKKCTRSTYMKTVEQFRKSVSATHGVLPRISEITPDDLINFLDQRVSARRSKHRERRQAALNASVEMIPPSPSTRQHRLNVISGFFKTAIYLGYATNNLAQNYSAMAGRKRKDGGAGFRLRKKALTADEKKRFFKALVLPAPNPWPEEDGRHRAFAKVQPSLVARNLLMFLLFEATGVRVSGLAGMTIYDIDPAALEVTVTEKGNKTRVVPIISTMVSDTEMRELITRYISFHRQRIAPKTASEYLWVNQRGSRLSVNMIQKICADAMKRAGLVKPNFGPHLLRHTFATDKLDAGGTIRDVAMVLGHEGLQTITTYDSGEQRAARARLRRATSASNNKDS